MLPITPAGKYTVPSRLRWLWATFSSRSRDHDRAKIVSQNFPGSGPPTVMPEGEFWHRHLHRLQELDRDERRAVRTSIFMAVGVFVTVAALLTVVRLFGLSPETQYAMVRLF